MNNTNNEEMIFPDQNSTNFPISVKNNLENITKQYSKKDFLKYHQFIIFNYMIKNPKSRGLLLFHEMGMGKSITAAALAEFYRLHDPDRKIVILLSKSLQSNFQGNIEKIINEMKDTANNDSKLSPAEIDRIIEEKYKFVSLNASNMFTQMTRVNKTKGEMAIEKQLKTFTDVVEKEDFLENSLLIIDEFHNLSNSITNGSYNAIRLYDTIMKTKNIKLLFLTGTPIINKPFELVPTFNMLKGLIQLDAKLQMPLFPELQKDFNVYFVDKNTNKIKNAEKFKNRIFGMVSYYGSMYFGKKSNDDFPEEYPTKVERVPMSSEQYARYDMARDFEREESSNKGRMVKAERFSSKGSASSSYRVQSRQISNYLIPEYALGPARGRKARQKFINKITKKDLENQMYSPKFKKILDNVDKHKNQLGMIYSEFVSGEGLAILSNILESRNYSCWNTNIKLEEDSDAFGLNTKMKKGGYEESGGEESGGEESGGDENEYTGGGTKKFALITGDVSFEERAKIIKIFNNKNNMKGENISLLLISKTGAEGLDLKNVRHVHITEPYWNMARIEQIIARAVRYKSHVEMDKKDRNVQPYVYLSDYPKTFDTKKKKEHTTDVQLYSDSVKNKKLIMNFLITMAEASVDCSTHSKTFSKATAEKIKCKMCSPNNVQMYNPILSKQLLLPNPCQELKKNEIKATSISIPGRDDKYFYSKTQDGEFHIYSYNTTIDGYTLMDSSNPVFSDIMKKLLKMD
jgi:superfamily II DNA or RNA helicase